MKLLKLHLNNFRRFLDQTSLDLNGSLIALVGPNEAGKTSVLDALLMVGNKTTPAEKDVTRGREGPARIIAYMLLEREDLERISAVYNADIVTHLKIVLSSDEDEISISPSPHPERDKTSRKKCLKDLRSIAGHESLDSKYSKNENLPWSEELFESVVSSLESGEDSLPSATIKNFQELAKRLQTLRYRPRPEDDTDEAQKAAICTANKLSESREEIAQALIRLGELEAEPAPSEQIADILADSIPQIVSFTQGDRDLESAYRLKDITLPGPRALTNLLSLAELDLEVVSDTFEHGRPGQLEKMFEEANSRLRSKFEKTWTQSVVYPRLGTPSDGVLRIYVSTEGEESYSLPSERSDGLKWFIALHAFLAANEKFRPLLLVDEAETHLHYDAQADLVDAFMRQKLAPQVIYTTHSIGCLPSDLGAGIRVIQGAGVEERSAIFNSYWAASTPSKDKVGYAPLLFAMGAGLLSLTVPRYGVITEGPSDSILLPAVFREVSGLEALPYRVVPGMSELERDRSAVIKSVAARSAFLTDGDEHGDFLIGVLREAGVEEERLFSLRYIHPGCTLEDLVDGEVFMQAINQEIEDWGLANREIDISGLPDIGRWGWLRSNEGRFGFAISNLSKPRLAQRIVDCQRKAILDGKPYGIVSQQFKSKALELHGKLLEAFELLGDEYVGSGSRGTQSFQA